MAGRGGRGAALLRALEEMKRRPGDRPPESTLGPPPPRPGGQLGQGDAGVSSMLPVAPPSAAAAQSSVTSVPSISPPPPISRHSDASNLGLPAARAPLGGRGARFLSLIQQTSSKSSSVSSETAEARSLSSPHPTKQAGRIGAVPLEQMSALSVKTVAEKQVVRMHGDKGTKIPMTANYIRLKVQEGMGVFEYHVSFNPQIDCKGMRFQLVKQQEEYLGSVRTFDGAKLYLPKKLPDPVVMLNGKHPVDQSPVKVYIKFISQKDYKDCIHLYNILFRRIMSILKMTQVGRHYYSAADGIPVPQHKLEVWPGYVTAVDEFEDGLMLLCDVSHRVLQTTTVLEKLSDVIQSNKSNFKQAALKALLGCIVMTKYNNKTYRIDEIEWNETPLSTFKNSAGQDIAYIDYYKKQYNIDIVDHRQPLLIHREKPKKGEDITRLVCLVPELSVMTGLTDEMRSDFRVMKDIAAHTRVTPNQRQFAYKKFLENVQNNPDAKRQLMSWGLQLDTNTIKLTGRVLPPTTIILKTKHIKTTAECDWSREVSREPALVVVPLKSWVVIFNSRDGKKVSDFVDTLKNVSRAIGMQVNEPRRIEIHVDRNEAYINALRSAISNELQIVVIVFPTQREDRYSAVKKFTCCECPVPSQVINARTIGNPGKLRSIVQKIALQMNCKLGGELWAVKILMTNAMICGIDVYHDATQNKRSVAGFVSSLNATCTRWYSRSCFQEPNQELVHGLCVCLIGALKKFFEVNHALPESIVIFRDGVGDGQLNFVSSFEVEQLSKAFEHFPNYEPKLVVVVVQKRINTRLFTWNSSTRQIENPCPGIVMDNTITRKHWYDFFLVSQHVRQGTVSPTHYIVVHDSLKMKPDNVQQLSYTLTHLYFNWPGTVRVPAPCQYAHKLAQLVGQNLHKPASHDLSDKLFFL